MAHASSTAISNDSKCDGVFTVRYSTILCSNDNNVSVKAGSNWSKGSGACVISDVSGFLLCDGNKVNCQGTSYSKASYSVTGNSATCQIV